MFFDVFCGDQENTCCQHFDETRIEIAVEMSQDSMTSEQEASLAELEAAMEAAIATPPSSSHAAAGHGTLLDSPSTPEELAVWEPKRTFKKRHAPDDAAATPAPPRDNTQDFGEVKVLWVNSVPFVHSSKTGFVYCGTAVMSREGRGIDSYVDCFTCSCNLLYGHQDGCTCECHLLKDYYLSYQRARNAKSCRIGPLELPSQPSDSQVAVD